MVRTWHNPYAKNKFNAQRTEYNGRIYASKKEATKAMELDLLVKAGEVLEWKPQPEYLIVPHFAKMGKLYRPMKYIPDFWVKWKDGHEEVIDIKGFPTPAWKLKEKMFNYRFRDIKLVVE